jgi:hypothetical protein
MKRVKLFHWNSGWSLLFIYINGLTIPIALSTVTGNHPTYLEL